MKEPQARSALTLRVSLQDTLPEIYRTILVPAHITLPKLHTALQIAMGWQGGHLHEFIINDEHYGEIDPDFPQDDLRTQNRVRLDKALQGSRRFEYLYDFGDSWWHDVRIVDVAELAGPLAAPRCLDGARACPPEDVGGVPGYEDFLDAMANPAHPEHETLLAWHGGPYDPEAFDLDKVNRVLGGMRV